jgi:hypothetical protein
MTSNLTKFNNQLNDFMLKLIDLFPEEKSISVYHDKFCFIRKIHPRKIYNNMLELLYPYKDHIMNKDDTFFFKLLDDNRKEIDKQESLLCNINFHKLWKSDISDDIRNAIWQYFQVIIILMEQIIQTSK